MNKLTDWGTERSNECAHENNSLRLDKCPVCQNDKKTCEHKLIGEVPATASLVSISYNGENVAIEPAVLVSEDVAAAICAAIEKKVNKPYATATYADGTLTVFHRGQLELSSLTFDDDTVVALTSTCCKIVNQTKWRIFINGELTELTFGDEVTELEGTYDYDPADAAANEATAAALLAELEAKLTAAGISFDGLSVTVNDDEETFVVDFWSKDSGIMIEGTYLTACGTREAFDCSDESK